MDTLIDAQDVLEGLIQKLGDLKDTVDNGVSMGNIIGDNQFENNN